MAKKVKRLNPYNPKVYLYSYAIKPKYGKKLSTVASGHSFGLSKEKLIKSFSTKYDPKYYTYTVKRLNKRIVLKGNYDFDKPYYDPKKLYI